MTNIVVAFPKIQDAKNIRNILVKYGFHVSAVASTGAQALELCDALNDGVLVLPYRLPDMMYMQIKEDLGPGIEMLLLSSRANISESDGDVVCVEMPLKVNDLINTVAMLVDTVESSRRKRRAKIPVRDDAAKEVIAKAKELLMGRNGLSEAEAHRYIQKTSMNSGNNMKETAEMILELFA